MEITFTTLSGGDRERTPGNLPDKHFHNFNEFYQKSSRILADAFSHTFGN